MDAAVPSAPASRPARNLCRVDRRRRLGIRLADHWTLRFEYLFTSFPGSVGATGAITDAAGGSNPLQGSANLVIQTARAGVNFKF